MPDPRRMNHLVKTFGTDAPASFQAGVVAAQMTPASPFTPGEPILPFDGFSRTPRVRDFTPNYNVATRPRSFERIGFDTLKGLIQAYDVAQMCIWHRIDSIRSLDWNLVAAPHFDGDVTDAIRIGMAALKRPDRRTPFSTWLAAWLYDILAYDAGALYRLRNMRGDAVGLLTVDGTTIAPLLDYWGRTPAAEETDDDEPPAFVQYANGLPWNWLTISDLIYEPFRKKNDSPYGLAPLETILLNANTDLRFQKYFLDRFTEGNIPQAFASAPESWSPDQIEQWQTLWDSFMAGDQAQKHTIKWMPGGSTIAWSNEKDFTDQFSLFLMRKTCLDEETEILTQRGWIRFADLRESDDVATRSAEGEFEWQRPTDYIAEPYSGDMVQFKSNSLDLLVTPEHRMLLTYFPTKKHPQPKEFIRKAGEIVGKGGYMIPMRSHWGAESPEMFVLPGVSYEVPNRGGKTTHTVTKPDVTIPMNTWAAFLGLWLAEGHVDGSAGGTRKAGHGRGLTHRVGIAQSSDSPYFGEIQALLDSLPFTWTRSGHMWVCQDKRLHAYLAPLGNSHTKYIPAEIKELGSDTLETLWAWACKGDGHHYQGKTWHMITASERLAGDWQEILQKCGRDASVSLRPSTNGGIIRGRQITGSRPTWVIRERTSPLRTAKGTMTSYEGMVYCVSVPNGVIYVRRNGRPAWVGNCAAYHVVPTDLGFTETANLSTGESQADVQHRIGDLPLIRHAQGVLTSFLQDDLGLPLEFLFDLGEEQADRLQQAQADQIYVQIGAISPSEVRSRVYGLEEPDGIPVPRFIYSTRGGPIPLASLYAVAGPIDPASAAPQPGTQLPHTAFGGVEGVIPNPPIVVAPLAEQEYGPSALPPAPPPQPPAPGTAPVEKDGEGAPAGPTAGITTATGITGYDLVGTKPDDEDDEAVDREQLVKQEMQAFRRFAKGRRRKGTWNDFEFHTISPVRGRRLNQAGRAAVRKDAGETAVAGLAVQAADTGRVLMLQRALDPEDPAGGTLEFPGGHLEGAETPLMGAWREWSEETGVIPPPGVQTGMWASGIYQGIVWTVDCEAMVPVRGDREITNPDDPDGDRVEAIMWLDPALLADNPAVRPELLADLGEVLGALGVEQDAPVEKASAGKGDAPAKGASQWPGWEADLKAADYWAPVLAAALAGALTTVAAQRIAAGYLAQGTAPDGTPDKAALTGAAVAWIAEQGLDLASGVAKVLPGLYTDGYLVGVTAAQAIQGGTRVDRGGWQPGDTRSAQQVIGESVAADGLADAVGLAPQTANEVAQSRLRDMARELVNGLLAGNSVKEIAAALVAVVSDTAKALTVAVTEITRASAIAARNLYQQDGSRLVRWLSEEDDKVCPACLAQEAAGPQPIADMPLPPLHPRCRCTVLPA